MHATGDADLLIVQTAVECAKTGATTVIGEDTDLLVLLCMHADISQSDIIFRSETKRKTKKMRVWDIKKYKGSSWSRKLSFASYYPCNCWLSGIGKIAAIKQSKNPSFTRHLRVFLCSNASPEEI